VNLSDTHKNQIIQATNKLLFPIVMENHKKPKTPLSAQVPVASAYLESRVMLKGD